MLSEIYKQATPAIRALHHRFARSYQSRLKTMIADVRDLFPDLAPEAVVELERAQTALFALQRAARVWRSRGKVRWVKNHHGLTHASDIELVCRDPDGEPFLGLIHTGMHPLDFLPTAIGATSREADKSVRARGNAFIKEIKARKS